MRSKSRASASLFTPFSTSHRIKSPISSSTSGTSSRSRTTGAFATLFRWSIQTELSTRITGFGPFAALVQVSLPANLAGEMQDLLLRLEPDELSQAGFDHRPLGFEPGQTQRVRKEFVIDFDIRAHRQT